MKPKVKTLKNGLRIVTVPMKDNPTVTVMVMVEAGTRYEDKKTNGLSHFLEHMCFKGTEKRTSKQIVHELEAMGAVTNAFTSYDYTGYFAKGRTALFPKILDVVSDVYLNSTFPEIELEKERGVICGEIDMTEDYPQSKVGYLGINTLYGDQPAGYTILGPKENILRFTRKDFLDYHKKHYIAEKTVVIVTGGIESADVEKQVMHAFASISSGRRITKKKVTKQTGERVVLGNKKTDQSHLYIAMRGLPMGHPDATAFEVFNTLFGRGMSSRLFMRLREEMGAGYYVSSDIMSSDDASIFEITTGTNPQRVPEIIRAIIDEIQKIKNVPVSLEELEKSKTFLIALQYMSSESSNRVAENIGTQAILHQPLKTPRDIEKEIKKVKVQDIARIAKKYLKPDQFHLALIGPHESVDEIKSAFHF